MRSKNRKLFLTCMLVLLTGTNVYAYNAKARIVFAADIFDTTIEKNVASKYKMFSLSSVSQINDDAITVEFSDENFGAKLGLWYAVDNNTASNGSVFRIRRPSIWVKPVDSVKVTIGYVANDQLFKERITQWKVGSPFNLNERDWGKHPGYVNPADVDDMGISVEVNPINGLVLSAAVARPWGTPGKFSNPFMNFGSGSFNFTAWGVTGRYHYGNYVFQAAYRDNGCHDWKVARCAVGYEANGIYAFIQPCFGIDWNEAKKSYSFDGLCIDAYGEYRFDAWSFAVHLPVTVRFTNRTNDPSYFEWQAVARYNLGYFEHMQDLTAYLMTGSISHDGDNKFAMYRLNRDFMDSLNLEVKAGMSFSVGSCAVDTGVKVEVPSSLTGNTVKGVTVKVPFSASLKF